MRSHIFCKGVLDMHKNKPLTEMPEAFRKLQKPCYARILELLDKGAIERKPLRDILTSENYKTSQIAQALKELSDGGWIVLKGSSHSPKQLIVKNDKPVFTFIIKQLEDLKESMQQYISEHDNTETATIFRNYLSDYKRLKKKYPEIDFKACSESSDPKVKIKK